ncbi:MAG: iron-sulfur cluster assembly scaffold protein [Deltaproteobacteria bacterium]|nr:iron-sulfur cluster assembly scaffold protein [Deltaproteobacteria bacterium]
MADEGQRGSEARNETGEESISARVLQHIVEPAHAGGMEKPSGYGVITGPCGDTDEFFVRVAGERLREVRFRTSGCFFTIAACDAVATLAEGRTVREAMRIDREAVIEYLEGMPEDHKHCALLAANTLHKALRDYAVRGSNR